MQKLFESTVAIKILVFFIYKMNAILRLFFQIALAVQQIKFKFQWGESLVSVSDVQPSK